VQDGEVGDLALDVDVLARAGFGRLAGRGGGGDVLDGGGELGGAAGLDADDRRFDRGRVAAAGLLPPEPVSAVKAKAPARAAAVTGTPITRTRRATRRDGAGAGAVGWISLIRCSSRSR
jgi:hypothetical protein